MKVLTFAIFGLALTIRLAYFGWTGVHHGGDSAFYLDIAHRLSEAHYSLSALVAYKLPIYYWFYPFFVAILRHNEIAIITVQIIPQAVASVLMYAMGKAIWNERTGILAGIGYGLFWEIFQWDVYVLTDSLFLTLLIASLYLLVRISKSPTPLLRACFILTIIVIAALRPTSPPFFAALLLAWIPGITWKRNLVGIGALIVIILGLLVALGFFRADAKLGFQSRMHYFASLYERGIIIRDRPQYTMPASSVGSIIAHRLVAFWYIYATDFSLAHKLVSSITFIPLYIGGLYGIYRVARYREGDRNAVCLVFVIMAFWGFQALTEVDYDWRYRLPTLPPLLLLASYGASKMAHEYS